jgi:hypothetical protein
VIDCRRYIPSPETMKVQREEAKAIADVPRCKLCGEPLTPRLDRKKGRPREYCQQCETSRVRERHRRWMKRQLTIC